VKFFNVASIAVLESLGTVTEVGVSPLGSTDVKVEVLFSPRSNYSMDIIVKLSLLTQKLVWLQTPTKYSRPLSLDQNELVKNTYVCVQRTVDG